MKLRQYKDKDGIIVELVYLELSFEYDGLIEGSRSGAHYVFRKQIQEELAQDSALYVEGFSEPDPRVEARWAQENSWPPAERVTVVCRSMWVPEGKHPHGRTRMTVKWYQDEGDPFVHLQRILSKISWKKYAKYEFVD